MRGERGNRKTPQNTDRERKKIGYEWERKKRIRRRDEKRILKRRRIKGGRGRRDKGRKHEGEEENVVEIDKKE